MKRIALLFLCLAMAIDVSGKAYNSDLFDAIAKRGPDRSVAGVVADSPVMTTIEHWAMFFIGFGVLSLLMTLRKPNTPGPDILN